MNRLVKTCFAQTVMLLFLLGSSATQAQTTAFTYQGKLTDAGQPANGNFDLQFKLFDAVSGGTQQGGTLTNPTVAVSNGVFTVTLDFGANVFSGAARFLEIAVRPAGSVNPYTVLAPRQPVQSTPYAIQTLHAASADSATTAVNFSGALTGDVTGTQSATAISNNAVTTPKLADASVTNAKLADGSVSNAKIADVAGSKLTGAITTATIPGANVTSAVANATNATSATTAVSFSGALAGDVSGTQGATTVSRLQGRNVANAAPLGGQVLKFNSTTNQWEPDTDNISGGGGGGTITGVTAGTGLTGGGTTGNVTVGIGAGGVGTGQLAEGSVVDSKIVTVSGAKVIGQVTDAFNATNAANATNAVNATNATTAVNFSGSLAGNVTGTQSATVIANNAVTTPKIADGNVTDAKIATVAGSKITGAIPVAAVPAGSTNYIQNTTTQQASSNFSISGNGIIGGSAFISGNSLISGNGTINGNGAINGDAIILGSVGIGNNPASEKLHVRQDGNYQLRLQNSAAGGGFWNIGQSDNIFNIGGGKLAFVPDTSNSSAATVVFTNSGRVGINATTPTTTLEVVTRPGTQTAVAATSNEGNGVGLIGRADSVNAVGVFGISANGNAGFFNGKVHVNGTLSKTAGSFKIDHPLDPENRYLSHSFVESPDMMNIYNGNVTTDANGEATVTLPVWFEALNKDFRYQLTVIGTFAQAIVAEKVRHNQFKIKTSLPAVEVSWQVTGIRQDAYANKHRIQVEEDKPEQERGSYLSPEVFNQPEEKGVEWKYRPDMMRQMKEAREKAARAQNDKTAAPAARPNNR